MPAPRIYTRTGDDGTTGLLYGGRVPKSAPAIEVNGAVDEAQAALGVARAETAPGSELHELLVGLERDLWVLMAEVATAPGNRRKLVPGKSAVDPGMVESLERRIDELLGRFSMPAEFVIPGGNRVSALLDLARTVVRRAERLVVAHPPDPQSLAARYLNRLSDLLWAAARWQDGAAHLTARGAGASTAEAAGAAKVGDAGRAGATARDDAGTAVRIGGGGEDETGEDEAGGGGGEDDEDDTDGGGTDEDGGGR